jgi:hypothetical protein
MLTGIERTPSCTTLSRQIRYWISQPVPDDDDYRLFA